MIIRAWATVVLFRLSLGNVDRLHDCISAFQSHSGLGPRLSMARLQQQLAAWPLLEDWTQELARFVPGRFLGSWFPEIARVTPYDRRGSRAIIVAADRAWGTAQSGPYRLIDVNGDAQIELAPGWRAWLEANCAIVRGFTEQQLTHYLQARNPSVPGIIGKLAFPRRRSLAQARLWWSWIIAQPQVPPLQDIFAQSEIAGAAFEIDHFLPWSFVAHDEFWNLSPIPPGLNRDKADQIPDLDVYLPRLACLHAAIVSLPELPARLKAGYAEFLGQDIARLDGILKREVVERYEEVIRPLAQIAVNQGFPGQWRGANDRRAKRIEDGGNRLSLLGSVRRVPRG
jgi:hypothetical protein